MGFSLEATGSGGTSSNIEVAGFAGAGGGNAVEGDAVAGAADGAGDEVAAAATAFVTGIAVGLVLMDALPGAVSRNVWPT